MEKQLERRREPEPTIYFRILEQLWEERDSEMQKLASLPRVFRGKEMPYQQSAQAHSKHFANTGLHRRLSVSPNFTMTVSEQFVLPGSNSGRHRHYNEAIFYVLEGAGYEIHDDTKYPWQAGDIMFVPTYCVHQHFNPSDTPARFFFSTATTVCEFLGIGFKEQFQMHPGYKPPEGAQLVYDHQGDMTGYRTPQGKEIRFGQDKEFQKLMRARQEAAKFADDPRNSYDRYLKLHYEQTQWRRSVPHVIKDKDCPWEATRMGKLKYFVNPFKPSGLMLYDAFLQEIPPGGRSGKHRHVSEEVHRILSGKGYDIQDGVRWDWQEEDVVFIPINTVHQHFNADPHRPARFIAFQSRLYHYVGHGGFEHLEDAPEFRP